MSSTVTHLPKPSRSSGALPQELKALALVLREEFEAPFRFYDAATGGLIVVPGQAEATETIAPRERTAALEMVGQPEPKVVLLPGGRYLIGFPLAAFGPSHLVALGVVPALARTRSEAVQEMGRVAKWSRLVYDRVVGARGARDRQRDQAEQDRQSMIAWEAMISLERLHRGARIHKESTRERQRVLRAAGELLGVHSLAWVPVQRDDDVVFEGERLLSPWDCGQLANVLAGQAQWEQSGYVIINNTGDTSWGARFPQVLNLLGIPIADRKLTGWVLAFNKRRSSSRVPGGREPGRPQAPGQDEEAAAGAGASTVLPFRRADAALLLPFASLVGLHVRASRRYLHIKDLLVGLTRSLTAAIDAKDAYTYGHSERVARAAVELGRELGLREDELSDIYLAGLLHDIGKIGIRDDVLTKRGPLTDEEFKHIQQHVVIGHRILADLHAIEHLLPGVLYHHERYDGAGYPEGLKGDAIPLLARILAVADSFDAMNTSRPYRTAMPPERVDEILRQGSGSQWDPLVIDAFVRCRDRLQAIRQRGLGESLRDALDGALRLGPRANEFASMEVSLIGERPRIPNGLGG
jgi:HD-GYP domain-containing protein (c-di-GMP phosphodiesterase class II)